MYFPLYQFYFQVFYLSLEEQHNTVVKVFDSTGAKGSPVQFPVESQNLFPSLLTPLQHLTCWEGALDGRDLTVSSDQGNAWSLYTLLW